MKRVVIRAPLLSKSGYGVHSRQVFQYLLSQPNLEVKTQIVPWGITPWCVNPSSYGGLAGEAERRSASESDRFDVSFQVQLPNEWDPSLAQVNVGVTAGVETDKCNPIWTSVHCSKMDCVIVPSDHTKNTLLASGATQTPIHVVPEAYFPELLNEPKPLGIDLPTAFNFLTVGVLTGTTPDTDRKNLFYLIKWFVEEFRDDDDIGLIIKTNRGRETAIDRSVTEKTLRQVLMEVGHTGTPRVYFLHGDMSRDDMNSLYRDDSVKAFISATRGEGFGLPLLEATVAELPVMATNWSAHTEFLNQGKWIKFDYTLCDVPPERIDNNIFVAGSRWANPLEQSIKSSLRKFKKQSNIPRTWAKDLSEKVKETNSMSSVMKHYDRVVGDILR